MARPASRARRGPRPPSRALGAALATLALLAPSECPAQPARPSPPSQPAAADPEAVAQAAFDEAMVAWRRGDCRAAATSFERAMEAAPHRDTLYNLARAYQCTPDVPRALDAYRRFLAEATDPADREDVRQRIDTLLRTEAEVLVASEPLDAAVKVDGGEGVAGRTPARLRLAPGPHVLLIEREGYRQEVRRVVVEPGVDQDLPVVALAALSAPPGNGAAPPVDRVLARRNQRVVTGRLALVTGFSVPRDRPVIAAGAEAGIFYRRSLALQAHALWIDTGGAPFVVGADLGWVFALEEVDLGLFVTGSALFSCELACREDTFRRDSEQFIGGFAVRADVVLHPRLSVGLFGRAAWRNFDLSNSEALLATGGLALSLFL